MKNRVKNLFGRLKKEKKLESLKKALTETLKLDCDGNNTVPFDRAQKIESIIKTLIELDNPLEAKDEAFQRSILHWAAQMGYSRLVKLLIERGADVNNKNTSGELPLHLAAIRGHEKIVGLLIEEGADVNTRCVCDVTALYLAAMESHEAVLQLLVQGGADVNSQDHYGNTALHWASENGHEGIVRLLIENESDISVKNNDGEMPLHLASVQGHSSVVECLLIKNCALINERSKLGLTALQYAIQQNNMETIKVLLKQGAKLEKGDLSDFHDLQAFSDNKSTHKIISV